MVTAVLGVTAAVVVAALAVDAAITRYTHLSKARLRLFRTARFPAGRVAVYVENRDLWVGVFVDRRYLYFVVIPTVVIRLQRRVVEPDPIDQAMHTVWLEGNWRWATTKMTTQAREAAAAAVFRYHEYLDPDEPVSRDSVAWWE